MKQINILKSSLVFALCSLTLPVLAQTAPTAAPATTTTQTTQSTVTETPTSTTVTTTTITNTKPEVAPASRKDSVNAGFLTFGYYEHSTLESLYFDFTADEVTASGLGFKGFFEYGLNERLAVGGALSFAYLLDANFDVSLVSRSFWGLDAFGSYYFADYNKTIQPYVLFGGGILFSNTGLTPILDIGGGAHFKLSETISLKAELMGKTGIVHNRGEVGLGVAFHF